MTRFNRTQADKAWKQWWEDLGHVARCNRDLARTREAFEAGYMAAVAQAADVTSPQADTVGEADTFREKYRQN